MSIYDKGFLFKGYIVTENKKSIEKFKNRSDFKSFDQVKGLPEFAGVLADDIVLIDIDDRDESERLLNIIKGEKVNCVVIQTTRGKHFYFKNTNALFKSCKTKSPLAVGISADVKLGVQYSVLKLDGSLRPLLLDSDHLDAIPVWLQTVSTKVDFDLAEGDGRNQTLYNYILPLQAGGMGIEDIRNTIRIINNYMLRDPLSDDELEVILRDDAFKKRSFFKGTRFLHDQFAAFLKESYHIIKVERDGGLLIFKNGVYEYSEKDIERAMILEIPHLKSSQRKEVLTQLDLICDEIEPSSCNLITFRNGILDVSTGILRPFSSDLIITNRIEWDYNPNAYDELTNKTLNKIACGDASIRALLEEMIGVCFYRSNKTLTKGKAFILTGEKSNGKSTFLTVLSRILGKRNISALDFKELNDRFSTIMLYGKLANIGDDISDEFKSDVSTFKKIVTGDVVTAEQKGMPKIEFSPYCKLIFSANSIPRMKDKTGAAQDRLLIIPFNARFSVNDPDYDPQISLKMQSQGAIEYLIRLGVDGLKRVMINKKFTSSAKVQKELDDYAERNDPLLSFINECEETDRNVVNEHVNTVFQRYREFCIVNGYQPLACNEFSKQVQKKLGCTSKRIGKSKVATFLS